MNESSGHHFLTTHWTHVVSAKGNSPGAKQALRELCETYYAPIELFIQRYRGNADARDLTHDFFAKLLEQDGQSIAGVDRNQGRFRTYLLGAVKHYLADQQDQQRALKRGGGQASLSLQQRDNSSEDPHSIADPSGFPPDEYFDRQWALAVVKQAIEKLRAEAENANDIAKFKVLEPWLVSFADRAAVSAAACSLDITENAFRVAVHRIRKQFRQIVVGQIAQTIVDPKEVSQELDYLIAAISSAGK